MRRPCYLCGALAPETRDHIPPASFFPEPRPSNLITVPCCEKCNSSYKLDDEAFRAWISMADRVSSAGQWIRDQRVLPRTIKRSPKLAQHIRESLSTVIHNGHEIDLISFPRARVQRFLVRITKGLLASLYPSIDSSVLTFEADHIILTEANREPFEALRDNTVYACRGDDVFQFRRFVAPATGHGIWLFCFYASSLFAVKHLPVAGDQPATTAES